MRGHDDIGAKIVSFAVVALGIYVIYEGTGMNVGSLRRIGPGFFPIVLGVAITLLGAATLLEPSERDPDIPFGLRPLFCVSLALLAFALLARNAGLVPATIALVALTTVGQRQIDLKAAALTTVALCAIGYLVFILGLRLPLELVAGGWPGGGW